MEDGDGAITLLLKNPVDPVTIPSNSSSNPSKECCEPKYEDDSFRNEKESSSSISSDSSCSDIVNGILDKDLTEQDHKQDIDNKEASSESFNVLDETAYEHSKYVVPETDKSVAERANSEAEEDTSDGADENPKSNKSSVDESYERNEASNESYERNEASNDDNERQLNSLKYDDVNRTMICLKDSELEERDILEVIDNGNPELKKIGDISTAEKIKDEPKNPEVVHSIESDVNSSQLREKQSYLSENEIRNTSPEYEEAKVLLSKDLEQEKLDEDSKIKAMKDESIEVSEESSESDISDTEIHNQESAIEKLEKEDFDEDMTQNEKQNEVNEEEKVKLRGSVETLDIIHEESSMQNKEEKTDEVESMKCEPINEQCGEVQAKEAVTEKCLAETKSESEMNLNDSEEDDRGECEDFQGHGSQPDVLMIEKTSNEEVEKENSSNEVDNNMIELEEQIGDKLNSDSDAKHEDQCTHETRKRKLSVSQANSQEELSSPEGNMEYKGFKKRILAQASQAAASGSDQESEKFEPNCAASTILMSHQTLPPSSTQQTEYAQYLGLQPTVKFKCYKCGESGFPSMLTLQEHQAVCLKSLKKEHLVSQPTPVQSDSSTNIRVTRKVYLCSSCGTYYENWNLFLHMREVHKRFICLFCLGMLGKAERLANHLRSQHNITENSYKTVEDFLAVFDKPCFLVCCTCERMFMESDNFHNHTCTEQGCSLCGLQGAHFPTCRRALSNSTTLNAGESIPESQQNSQVGTPDKSGITSKQTQGDKKPNSAKKIIDKVPSKLKEGEPSEDDVIDASTFCQINLQEISGKQKQTPQTTKGSTKVKGTESNSNKDSQDSNVEQEIEGVSDSVKESLTNTEITTLNKEKNDKDMASRKTIRGRGRVRRVFPRYSKNKSAGKNKKNLDIQVTASEMESNKDDIKLENLADTGNALPDSPKNEIDQNSDCEKQSVNIGEPGADDQENADVDPSSIATASAHIKHEDKLTESEFSQGDTVRGAEQQDDANVESKPEETEQTSADPEVKTVCSKEGKDQQPIATDGDSDSETSDSVAGSRGTDEESSSSSESTSEEPEKEKARTNEKSELEGTDESDADNADSDKMSLVVDENRSADEPETTKDFSKAEVTKNIYSDSEEAEDSKVDKAETKTEEDVKIEALHENKMEDNIQIAGEEVPILELTLEENVDVMTTTALVKECVKVSCSSCVFCNHAKKIAVNGKQLVLHLLAEHRFEPVVCSDTGDLTPAEGFIEKLKASVLELQDAYLNTETYDSTDKSFIKPYDRTYECFHCIFITTLHKELYVHNRKMHQKTILLCIMCKSNFYSYSELLCHLCPGIYVPDSNITFRCCLCSVDGLPSAFRLMVHLRKRHHACDVCLETTGDQQRLSNHVWKHKLHHLCYRCGIAYRNKPDITKHLFWKHGTESVLCKKCLQKKWPHVYHFCIPPTAFNCEECNLSFSRAVALKVHKRLHAGDTPYSCESCHEKFISKKLLARHQLKHVQPSVESATSGDKINLNSNDGKQPDDATPVNEGTNESLGRDGKSVESGSKFESHNENKGMDKNKSICEDSPEKKTKVVDVYDLPPLNLSSDSDDSDDNSSVRKVQTSEKESDADKLSVIPNVNGNSENDMQPLEEENTPVPLPVDGIWDNFKNYKANLEKRENQQADSTGSSTINPVSKLPYPYCNMLPSEAMDIVLSDHDYCINENASTSKMNSEMTGNEKGQSTLDMLVEMGDPQVTENTDNLDEEKNSRDHNYCYNNENLMQEQGKEKDNETLSSISSNTNILNSKNGTALCSTSVLNESNSHMNQNVSNNTISSASKKKPKTPRKKQKRSGSSSSSDSSSNSDSSSCSCGTNCSCSSSSSSSSVSSSSASSDSDSSTSEGRRRQAAKRERRKEKMKKKVEDVKKTLPLQSETNASMLVNGVENTDRIQPFHVVPESEGDMPIHESDLETDETETDEDFYDQYPQRQANKLLAEKRNQLLLLAAVAPVNNGTINQPSEEIPERQEENTLPKKKIKSKRRKKSHQQIVATVKPAENKLKLNIPPSYYEKQASFSNLSQPISPVPAAASHRIREHVTPTIALTNTGSGSETESKRLSKRKRVPKRFYGDSSDEDTDPAPVPHPLKWRKVVQNVASSPAPTPPPVPELARIISPAQRSEEEDSESEAEAKQSSSDSSDSDSDKDEQSDADSDSDAPPISQTEANTVGDSSQQKNENLYCYCQCPYDEVSEMIACDGKDCQIEWFHFECVGIMVPPKGKWFCPDCRKKIPSRNVE